MVRYSPHLLVETIDDLWHLLGKRARTWLIATARHLIVDPFMGTRVVVDLAELVEVGLARRHTRPRSPGKDIGGDRDVEAFDVALSLGVRGTPMLIRVVVASAH